MHGHLKVKFILAQHTAIRTQYQNLIWALKIQHFAMTEQTMASGKATF